MSDTPCSIASHLSPLRKSRRLTRDGARRPAAASATACCSLPWLVMALRLMVCTHRHVFDIGLQDGVFCFELISDFLQGACSESMSWEASNTALAIFSHSFCFCARRHCTAREAVLRQRLDQIRLSRQSQIGHGPREILYGKTTVTVRTTVGSPQHGPRE
jgi:hypothetical protein